MINHYDPIIFYKKTRQNKQQLIVIYQNRNNNTYSQSSVYSSTILKVLYRKLVENVVYMKNYCTNKVLSLTLKEVKKAEVELKSRKTQVYDSASYQVIWTLARVVKISAMDLKLTDQSDILDLVLYPDPLKEAAELEQGQYYKFSFIARRNILKGGNVDGFAFEVIGIKPVEADEITIHLAQCLTEKIRREQFKQKTDLKAQHGTQHQTQQQQSHRSINSKQQPSSNIFQNNLHNKKAEQMQHDITKYCRQLGEQFDMDKISSHFSTRYQVREIERVLETLSEKGFIMDLGLVYEWVGDQQ